MPKFLLQRWHGLHVIWTFAVMLLLIIALAFFAWPLAVAGAILAAVVGYFILAAEKAFRKDLHNYITTLSYRIRRVGNEVIGELPFGIILYSDDKTIEWHNPYVAKMLGRESLVGTPLGEWFPTLLQSKEKEKDRDKEKEKDPYVEVEIGDRIYHTLVNPGERLIYFRDITELSRLRERYEAEKLVIGIVMMDNLEELTQGMDDQQRAMLLARVTTHITEWAQDYNLFLRRLASDRYLIILDQETLRRLEQSRFVILDEVRELTMDNKLPMTLSIGIAGGEDNFAELGQLAQTSLDIALGRGGDQVAVKVGEHLSFYGGKSNAVEKRTRVRVRVIAHALRDLVRESDQVLVMGHRMPDTDSVGAAIGVMKAAEVFGVGASIVFEGVNPSIDRMMEQIQGVKPLWDRFITPEQALHRLTPKTLVVVVDTHKASMVAEPKLLQHGNRKVVIDHHRRGEEFINDAVLIYMEPYASSTCELVTELLQYVHDRVQFHMLEATALLAGITVDTKNFSLRTGSRTFEAAGYLRRNGADTILIQRMLKEDLKEYIQKAEVMKHAKMLYNHIALAVAEPGRKFPQLLIAQVADTLLNMTDVTASFVIGERPDGLIGISARSLGQINVQVIMERMGGGGHLTNAAAQLEGTLEEAEANLKQILAEIDAEEGFSE
ncbi:MULTISPECIES: DHH family phosphoesterase [unclassified Paenibacillus]|uniref:DHH family phosphoesterase n=1 Tax=unclassified Paenibacillus TaxID=185978 RepID=UPI001C110EE2|nr:MULTISPECIES: DHH family phosphoesterase [unclassified Paenibacillus]MBU5441916.1 DHH family phosphoesterase [Paenibacillus sp. MSJ-34]CAH0121335.1 Cyclic-di-AMP phosphodiesterase GdpP [Paenibacillus sp. CECT 9249]